MREVGAEVPLSVNDYLKSNIRTVPDWPVAGVQFRDITPLLQNPRVFRILIDAAAIVDLPELRGSTEHQDAGLPRFTLVDFAGH